MHGGAEPALGICPSPAAPPLLPLLPPLLQLGSAATASEAPAAVESPGDDEDDFLPPVDEDPLVFSEEDLGSLMEPVAAVQEDNAAGEEIPAFAREVTEEHLR